MASEENEDLLQIPEDYPHGKYVLIYDPLDGSGNIDANITDRHHLFHLPRG